MAVSAEAVRCGNTWLIHLTSGRPDQVLVDGKTVEKWPLHVVSEAMPILEEPVRETRITRITNEAGETLPISPEEYESQQEALWNVSKENGDYSRSWPSIEAEFAYRKFREAHRPVYESFEVKRLPIQVKVFHRAESDYRSIQPYVSGMSIEQQFAMCCWRPKIDVVETVQKLAIKHGLKLQPWGSQDEPFYFTLDSNKLTISIDGHYLNVYDVNIQSRTRAACEAQPIMGLYPELVQKRQALVDAITRCIKSHVMGQTIKTPPGWRLQFLWPCRGETSPIGSGELRFAPWRESGQHCLPSRAGT